ncbi:calcitonin gene-related peptide type 1 receptor-like isoform X2 [Biomphalaria glabrata]|uniref:Calcitonin gene-related peptide type 1 receptor-like isoform X2 n=1 Tax=Biomphalaria glabrata TaxID=6526 RepID=A0A9W2YAB2_BIOGL|nr:calcitonin gene-related peptide type 1 receptor-like isoform X2 [Biomphalaria glabrata]
MKSVEVPDEHVDDLKNWRLIVNATCEYIMATETIPQDGVYCPIVLDVDNLVCINFTRAGEYSYADCPPIWDAEGGKVRLFCESNGTWRTHSNSPKLSVDTQECDRVDTEDTSHLYVYIVGASVSLVLLSISLIIFHGFRQLRCDRITVHKNLFISFFLNTWCWLIMYRFVSIGDVTLRNPMWCQVLHVVAHYFVLTNFAWMFCEGLYLHFILVRALRTGKVLIKCLIACGWGLPFVIVISYALARGVDEERRAHCWSKEDIMMNIISVPIYVTTAVNTCLLINIIWLLLTKLRQIPDASQSRMAAKAILILVPLFGLQFLLMPVRPEYGTVYFQIYQHFMSLITSLQGAMLSCIFCFFNGEVRSLLRRKWQEQWIMSDKRRKNTGNTSSTFIDGYSMVDTTRDLTSPKSKTVFDQANTSEMLELQTSNQVFIPLVDNNGDLSRGHED